MSEDSQRSKAIDEQNIVWADKDPKPTEPTVSVTVRDETMNPSFASVSMASVFLVSICFAFVTIV